MTVAQFRLALAWILGVGLLLVGATAAAQPSTCRTATLPSIQLTLSAVPRQPHAVEGVDLAAHRQMTKQIRDLASVYEQCSPAVQVDPRESDPALAAHFRAKRLESEQHRTANLAAVTGPAREWADVEDAAIDREAACRAVPQCLTDRATAKEAARVANLLGQTQARACMLTRQRADDERDIRAEHSNPAGVMSLTVLHTAGADIQSIDRELPGLTKQYAQLGHKPFSPAVCQ